jgi:redox-sensitive bicupin YhaK (pirin superfamily)
MEPIVRVVVGEFWGENRGRWKASRPIRATWTCGVPPLRKKTLPVDYRHHAFAYVFEGSGYFSRRVHAVWRADGEGRRFDRSRKDLVIARSCSLTAAMRSPWRQESWAFVSSSCPGSPFEEPVAWYGPIVMNTDQELSQAVDDLRRGTFIKKY